MAPAWYVAHTQTLAEYRARTYLEARDFECFLPTVSTPSPRRGKEDAPLFPGYLFVRYELQERGTRALEWGQDLARLVTFDGVAPSVPDPVIDQLRQRVSEINGSGGLWRRFQPGDRVVVQLGSPGSGSLAEVVQGAESPEGRVRVLLELLGHQVQAQVPWRNVRPAPDGYAIWRHPRGTRGRGRHFRNPLTTALSE
jgi:transcriptional antiterminator RfaH